MSMMLYGRLPEVAKKINSLQFDLQCCGSFIFSEWFSITWSDKVSKLKLNLPKSCCDLAHYNRDECIVQAQFQVSTYFHSNFRYLFHIFHFVEV